MPLESGSTIQALDNTYPLAGDPTNRGDDHLRLIKTVLKNIFPGAAGQGFATPIVATEAEINRLTGVTSNIQEQLDNVANIVAAVKGEIYPVGSIYTNAINATNPADLLGFGTWQKFGEGRVQVGHSTTDPLFDQPEEIGGSKDAVNVAHSHTGTADTAGAHSHTYNSFSAAGGGQGVHTNVANTVKNTSTAGNHSHTLSINESGESGTNKNLQPYITVYMWKRTA